MNAGATVDLPCPSEMDDEQKGHSAAPVVAMHSSACELAIVELEHYR